LDQAPALSTADAAQLVSRQASFGDDLQVLDQILPDDWDPFGNYDNGRLRFRNRYTNSVVRVGVPANFVDDLRNADVVTGLTSLDFSRNSAVSGA